MKIFKKLSLLFIAYTFVVTGCSKKSESPKSIYGQVTTLAGSEKLVPKDGNGIPISYNNIHGIAIDASENVYVTDIRLNQVRKITPDGTVSTLPDNGPGSTTPFGAPMVYLNPLGIAIDGSNNLYVNFTSSNVIRKITPDGKGSVLAGNGMSENIDGFGTAAGLSQPIGVAVDGSGNIYVTSIASIRKILSNGLVTTLAGNVLIGSTDGKGSVARFKYPSAVATDASGNIYVADSGNNLIRKITPDGTVSTLAGSGLQGSADGKGTAASFNSPSGLAVDGSDNLYVADENNNMIRKITTSGNVTTIAGNVTPGSADGVGTTASFNGPIDVAVNQQGTFLYVTDNDRVRKIVIK